MSNDVNANTVGRIWLAAYPHGIPADIDADRYSSIPDVFNQACEKYRDLPAFTCMGKTLTYGELEQQARAFAGYLQNVLKLEKGDRVAVMMPNILQYPAAIFGILHAGYIVVNVNPLYTPRELEHQLHDSGAKVSSSSRILRRPWNRLLPGQQSSRSLPPRSGICSAFRNRYWLTG